MNQRVLPPVLLEHDHTDLWQTLGLLGVAWLLAVSCLLVLAGLALLGLLERGRS